MAEQRDRALHAEDASASHVLHSLTLASLLMTMMMRLLWAVEAASARRRHLHHRLPSHRLAELTDPAVQGLVHSMMSMMTTKKSATS